MALYMLHFTMLHVQQYQHSVISKMLFIWTFSQSVYHRVIVIWDHFCTGDESAACKSAWGDYNLQNSTSAIARWLKGQHVQPLLNIALSCCWRHFTVINLEHLVDWQVLKPWLQVIHSKLARLVELLDMVPTSTYRKLRTGFGWD
jgi:hypothetical protein